VPYEFLIVQTESGIAKITLNRPQVMNAFSPPMLGELKAAVEAAGQDENVGVVVITGAGRAFSSGGDLASMGGLKLLNGRVGPVFDAAANAAIEAIQTIPKVVIAAVNGYCLTGALEIALACDLLIVSENAKFSDTHVRWGIRPSWGMSQRLPRRVGWLKAKELSFTADMISAGEAERIGLVNKVVPAEKLDESVKEMAGKILANSLEAVAAYKYLYNQGMKQTLEKGLELESLTNFPINDTARRIDSFLNKK
jgi:enoyl-CoA hydratase/carnithine racemase